MTSSKQKTLLTVEEICSIIKTCGESGVTVLKFGDLYVRLGKQTPDTPAEQVLTPQVAAEIATNQAKVAEKALLADEIALKEQRLAELVLTDPVLAEELLTQGELRADGDENREEA